MRFRKIPRRCLIHTVKLAEVEGDIGAFGGEAKITETAEIKHVRFTELKNTVSVSGDNIQYSVNAVLIHQPGISDDCEFKTGSFIIFKERLYRIEEVCDFDELERYHHTEVKLSYVYYDKGNSQHQSYGSGG